MAQVIQEQPQQQQLEQNLSSPSLELPRLPLEFPPLEIPAPSTLSPTNFSTYVNKTYGIRIQYPADWIKNDTGVFNSSSRLQNIVAFYAPLSNDKNNYQSLFYIDIDNFTKNDLNEYLDETINSYKNDPIVQNFTVIVNNTYSNLAGYPAYKLIYSYTAGDIGIDYRGIKIATIVEGKGYSISSETDANTYYNYLPIIQDMIDSFQISTINQSNKPSNQPRMILNVTTLIEDKILCDEVQYNPTSFCSDMQLNVFINDQQYPIPLNVVVIPDKGIYSLAAYDKNGTIHMAFPMQKNLTLDLFRCLLDKFDNLKISTGTLNDDFSRNMTKLIIDKMKNTTNYQNMPLKHSTKIADKGSQPNCTFAGNASIAYKQDTNGPGQGQRQPNENLSILIDTDRIKYAEGQTVRYFGNISNATGVPFNGLVRIETNKTITEGQQEQALHPNTPILAKNGTYSGTAKNLKIGEYRITAVDLINGTRSSSTFEVLSVWNTLSVWILIIGIIFFIGLMIGIWGYKSCNNEFFELWRFICLTGIAIAPMAALLFAEVEIGANSIVGIIMKSDSNENGHPIRGGEWMINMGGSTVNNYASGIQIPFYVFIFGLLGGYLRYLYKAALKEEPKVPEEKLKETHTEESTQKETTKIGTPINKTTIKETITKEKSEGEKSEGEKHKEFLHVTIGELAQIWLAPFLAIAVYFILFSQEGDPNPYILSLASFTVGLITKDFIDSLRKIRGLPTSS